MEFAGASDEVNAAPGGFLRENVDQNSISRANPSVLVVRKFV